MMIGKGWLQEKDGKQTTGVTYRENILEAMFKARDKYVQRKREQGLEIPRSNPIMKGVNDFQHLNMKTVNPDVPNFAEEKQLLIKFGGFMCFAKNHERSFTMDQSNLQYFASDIKKPKKSLPIQGSEAFIQNKDEFEAQKRSKAKGKGTLGTEDWTKPNIYYRVGIQLKDRPSGPVYFYTAKIHDAKFLFVNIRLHGDQYKKSTMSQKVEMLYKIERMTRFQKLMSLLCFAKEKRFVQMSQYQFLSQQMVEIAQQSRKFKARTLRSWFANIMDDEDVTKIKSVFRAKPPKQPAPKEIVTETTLNQDIRNLKRFIWQRRENRPNNYKDEINR